MTAVKICGITRPEDARLAAACGAHAIGLVFYGPSRRCVSPAQARAIINALPPFVTAVGLFVDEGPERVAEVLRAVPLQLLQFHGAEDPETCAAFGLPYLKSVPVRPGVDLLQWAQRYAGARGLLLDAHVEGMPGGTGTTFDWSLIPRELPLPVVLAGGLHAGNVGSAIRAVRPWAVDTSSGVESAPGVKDPGRLREFMRGVRDADV